MGDVTSLLPAALQGDREARDELYRLASPELRLLALHWFRRYSAQERVRVSDVLERAFEKLMRVKSPGWKHRGQFYKFACRNIVCVLIDELRAQDRLRRLPQEEGDSQEALAETAQRRKGLSDASLCSLTQALDDLETELSPLHRQIVEQKHMGECSLDEIVEITETPRTTVDRKLKVAEQFLREKLQSSFPDFGHVAGEA